MKKISTIVLALSVMGGAVSYADLALVDDDFTSSSVVNASRFNDVHLDSGNWIKRDSAWSVTVGALVNPGLTSNDEKAAHLINSVTSTDTSLTKITVSFDYVVGAGTTLYFYSSLFTGDPTGGGLGARMSQTNGAWLAGDFNDGGGGSYGSGFAGPDYNLKDGSTPSGSTGSALASFAGGTSGTFSQTYDISAFGGGSFSIANVKYLAAVFASNNPNTGFTGSEISIDNFNMTAIPEPNVAALLGGLGAILLLRRRRV